MASTQSPPISPYSTFRRIDNLSKRLSALEEQVKEISELQEKVKEMPELQERIQKLEDESKKIRGVTTKGPFASVRELINWGMHEDTVIDKTVQAHNKKIAASGGKEIQASDVKAEARIFMPILHLGIHVSDMVDWKAALATTTNNLTDEYSLGICLAETAFETVFGFHPTNPVSAMVFRVGHGKSNCNLASSLILY
jgi:hypothetical protein